MPKRRHFQPVVAVPLLKSWPWPVRGWYFFAGGGLPPAGTGVEFWQRAWLEAVLWVPPGSSSDWVFSRS